jgi:hypothetical protein
MMERSVTVLLSHVQQWNTHATHDMENFSRVQ